MKKRLVHLRKKARKIAEEFKANGFNGVKFEQVRVQEESADEWGDPPELNKGQFKLREKHYLCLVAQPSFSDPFTLPMPENDYTEVDVMVDAHRFYDDLRAYFKKQFGKEVTINFNEDGHTFEWEIYRDFKHGGRYCYDHFHPKDSMQVKVSV